MDTQSPRQRTRRIIDPVKHRRHKRRKLIRRLTKWLAGVVVLLAFCFIIWFLLGQVSHTPPAE